MPYTVLDASTAAAAPIVSIGAPAVTGDSYTLQELYDELMLRLGDRTDVTLTRATRWINDAYRDIAASLDIAELKGGYSFTTVADQSLYMLPSNVRSINKASTLNNVSQLVSVDENRFRSLADASGDPTHYYQVGRMLVLYPTPTSAQTIVVDAEFRPQPLRVVSATSDRSILQPEWNEGLLRLATSYAFNALVEPELAANAENQFVSWTRRQKDLESDTQEDRVKHFAVVRSWRDLRRTKTYEVSTEAIDD